MKKINTLIAGLVILLSLGLNAFTESEQHALNRGDGGGAPARPDYVNIGDTGGAPADNRGDGGAPANFNKGDGGGISKQDSHADHF
ncbi:Phr family secreted Rap phosphatase inhibitor (plasmid) [Bacillus pacificus]|uniref:Phr family secreted Rap phosphatase inhibitor n=1 Tax=Bacillus TaxID=1386 RepID=UPI000B44A94A|nr:MULTISPECIES: Phr family secreted Rap phosphatase inhibitor [Bacillus]MDA2165928.1 Phr family secreted Rap phosphatase inhibitor [Bacillus cereus]MDQ7235401.1 Phr family secreted Rap phosphatase inhibitor [Bacillus pacificus]MDQ7242434.1 Phr family secreted Rap phosphatase inhibitor [Bacillus pacificus]MED1299082.1 Phr family secreted Rap phosphatase inhibitor [Bacillus pacificus]OUB05293.1 aspartate phosphatase [[Bacillus thuringiensis] serovar konkukian]